MNLPVLSSAAKMPFPGATIAFAMSRSSFFCWSVKYWAKAGMTAVSVETKKKESKFVYMEALIDYKSALNIEFIWGLITFK